MITTAANTTAVVTFTGVHGLAIGDVILVENLGVDFNGTVTLTAANATANTIGYTIPGTAVAANVTASIANNSRIIVVNSATEASNTATTYAAVTNLASVGGSTVAYNVPGNVNFNPDTAVDRIVISNEDPTA